jgi:hypothetical protein
VISGERGGLFDIGDGHAAIEATKMQYSTRGLPMEWAKHGVKIVHSDELDLNTPQTSGMTRAAAITQAKVEQASYGPAQWWFNRMPRPDRITMENWRLCFTW